MPITITHAKSDTIADWSGVVTVGNSTGGTATMQASNLVRPSDWNSAHQYTLSLTGSEIANLFTIANGITSSSNASGIVMGFDTEPYFEPFPALAAASTLSAPGIGTWYMHPFNLPFGLTSGQINMLGNDVAGFLHGSVWSAASTGSVTRSQTFNNVIALYRQGTGANTTRIESIWSQDCSYVAVWDRRISTANTSSGTIFNALTLSFPAQWNTAGGVTYSSTSQSGTTAVTTSTMASTIANNLITGAGAFLSGSKMIVFPFATTLAPGNYWFAHMISSTSASAGTQGGAASAGTMFSTLQRVFQMEFVDQGFKRLGRSVSDSSTLVDPWHGSIASTSSAPFATLGTSDMRNLLTNARAYWNYLQSSY